MKRIKNWWRDFLNRLGAAADEEFGGKPPKCCPPASSELNKKKIKGHDVGKKVS